MTHKFRKFRSWFRRGAVTRQRPAADTPSSPAPPRERYCTAACPDLTLARPAMAAPLHSTTCLYLSIVGGRLPLQEYDFPTSWGACSLHCSCCRLPEPAQQPDNPQLFVAILDIANEDATAATAITIPHLYGATNYWLERSDWNFMFYRILYTPYLESTSLIIFPCFPWRMVMSCSWICFSFFLNTGFSWREPKRCLK